MKKGKEVKRSTYQKVVEENKKLLKDIRILIAEGPPSAEKVFVRHKWLIKFKEDRELFETLKEIFIKPKIDQSKVIIVPPVMIREGCSKPEPR